MEILTKGMWRLTGTALALYLFSGSLTPEMPSKGAGAYQPPISSVVSAWTSAILGFEAMLAHLFTSCQVLHDVLLALAAVGFFIFWIRT